MAAYPESTERAARESEGVLLDRIEKLRQLVRDGHDRFAYLAQRLAPVTQPEAPTPESSPLAAVREIPRSPAAERFDDVERLAVDLNDKISSLRDRLEV